MNETEIKYCPSCGGEKINRVDGKGVEGIHQCDDCGCVFEVSFDSSGMMVVAITDWGEH